MKIIEQITTIPNFGYFNEPTVMAKIKLEDGCAQYALYDGNAMFICDREIRTAAELSKYCGTEVVSYAALDDDFMVEYFNEDADDDQTPSVYVYENGEYTALRDMLASARLVMIS